jgi:hypothetical protein
MTYYSYPNWRRPIPTADFLGTVGATRERDGWIVLDGERIPWPKGNASFYATDYESCDMLELKHRASARKMAEHKLRKKVDIVGELRKWDLHFRNTTPNDE